MNSISWTLPLKGLGFLSEIIGLAPFLLSLLLLKSIFRNYYYGEIFSASSARKYRKLGLLTLLDALFIKPFSNMLLVFAATLTQPPGHRYITIMYNMDNFEALFLGVLIVVVSWVMLEASKVYDEQKLTI